MTLKESILRDSSESPKRFASFVEKKFGLLFYMDNNKLSHDGNHVFLYPEKITDLGAVLDYITDFYQSKCIIPAIYHPYSPGYFKENHSLLEAHGYKITIEDNHRFMVLTAENHIRSEKRLDVEVLTSWDERIASDILTPSREECEIEVTRNSMGKSGSFLFLGLLNGKAVVFTNIHTSHYGCTSFDYIVTATPHRGNGYASELISFTVDYCQNNAFPPCYQWAGPSEHITYNAGFRVIFETPAGYANYCNVLRDQSKL